MDRRYDSPGGLDDSTKRSEFRRWKPTPWGDSRVRERALAWLRWLATAGAILAAWVAIDSSMGSGLASEAADDPEFFLFWGLPFAVAAVFLGWFALRGGRADVRDQAKHGCLGSVLLGSAVFLLYFASPLLVRRDTLTGAAAALLYAPLGAVLGLLIGIAVARARRHHR
jgi:drug/metabolite transporter (DMT)-like permease